MRTALTSTAAGIAVTAIGVVALIGMLGSASSAVPTAVPAPTTTVAEAPTTLPAGTTGPEAPVVVVVPAPTPELAGVGSAVGRVLYANGYATNNEPDELAGELPPAVLALLIEREVTLAIATEAKNGDNQEVTP